MGYFFKTISLRALKYILNQAVSSIIHNPLSNQIVEPFLFIPSILHNPVFLITDGIHGRNGIQYMISYGHELFAPTFLGASRGTSTSAEEAELIGTVNALAAAQKEGFDEVVLVSDSIRAIQAINSNASQLDWKKLFGLDQIQNYMQAFKFSL